MKSITRLFLYSATGLILFIVFADVSHAWKIQSKWECCYPKPRERVVVLCKDGRAPVFVNVDGRWCFKRVGQADDADRCFKTLDEGARWWCKE